jgi:hypothetical protein
MLLKDLKPGKCYKIIARPNKEYYIKYLNYSPHTYIIDVWYSRLCSNGDLFNNKDGFLHVLGEEAYNGRVNFYPISEKYFYKIIRRYNELGKFKEGEIL